MNFNKTILAALYACCEKQKGGRDNLKGVYYNQGDVVASDGHTLIRLHTGVVYDPVYEGRVVDRNGEFIEGESYPNYGRVIPQRRDMSSLPPETINDLRRLILSLGRDMEWIRVTDSTYLNADSLKRVFRVFDRLKQPPRIYVSRLPTGVALLESENCQALSMLVADQGASLQYAQKHSYDYDLLGT